MSWKEWKIVFRKTQNLSSKDLKSHIVEQQKICLPIKYDIYELTSIAKEMWKCQRWKMLERLAVIVRRLS